MKMEISWHQNCLKNRKSTLYAKLKEREQLDKDIDKLSQQNALYEAQIELAIDVDKDSFDADKFALRRLCT